MEQLKSLFKTSFWFFLNISLVVLAAGLFYGIGAVKNYGGSLMPGNVIIVSAEGKVVAIPDVAAFSFTVVSIGQDPVALQSENIQKMNGAIEFVKSQAVDEKDIKTTQFNLFPRYEYDEKRRQSFIAGYELRQSVQVKIRDLSKISPILGGLPNAGINEIGQLQFDMDNPEFYLNQAREQAFGKARAKAEAMASQNNVKIKRVVGFAESPNFVSPVYYAKAEAMGGPLSAPQPTIEAGSQEVSVNVNVTYEIR